MGQLRSLLQRFLIRLRLLRSVGLQASVSDTPHNPEPREVTVGLNKLKGKANAVPQARARVFEPDLWNGRYELSTFCIDDISEIERWDLLAEHIKPQVVARADLTTDAIRAAGLVADPDWVPVRHVNVIGWPEDEEAQKTIAQESLATMQRFHKRAVA